MPVTEFLDSRGQCWQVTVIDVWKQMMFNLIVQTPGKVVTKQATISKILRSHYLVLVEISIRCMRTMIGQMIYLGIHHETKAKHNPRHSCPDDGFPKG
jgi:hypothetical protein